MKIGLHVGQCLRQTRIVEPAGKQLADPAELKWLRPGRVFPNMELQVGLGAQWRKRCQARGLIGGQALDELRRDIDAVDTTIDVEMASAIVGAINLDALHM